MKTWLKVLVAVLVLLGVGGAAAYLNRFTLLPRLAVFMRNLRDPIGPTQVVRWQPGPLTPVAAPDARPPNIVVILADDLGSNDITLHGGVANGAVPTPNIDAIARQGVRFTNGYTGNATCAPSRAAILTGRYATRFGFEFTPIPKSMARMLGSFDYYGTRPAHYFDDREVDVPADAALAMPASEITLPELLQKQGYRTLMLGKWHLGEVVGTRPTEQGFDEFLGFWEGGQKYLPEDDPGVVNSEQEFDGIDRFLWLALPYTVRKDAGPRFRPGTYMTDYLGDEAVDAITANRNRPFFMYLAFNAPHTPLQATRADFAALAGIKDQRLRVYGAMIRALDRNVGKVLGELRRQGLERNTLVVFTSDNGGADYIGLPDINKPYRGWKLTFFEGGVHAPFFMKWPARIAAGTTYAPPIAHIDIFATAAAAADAPVPTDRVLDGVDVLPFARGEKTGSPHASLFWRSGHYRALIADNYKLQVSQRPLQTWLFDLGADPTERHNLAAAQPARVGAMRALLAHEEAQMAKPLWPSLLEGRTYIDHPLSFPDRPGDEYVYWAN